MIKITLLTACLFYVLASSFRQDAHTLKLTQQYELFGHHGGDLSNLPPPYTAVTQLNWSPDGQYLAAGDVGGWLHVWDMTTREKIYTNSLFKNWASLLRWTTNSQFLAVGSGFNSTGQVEPDLWIWRADGTTTQVPNPYTGMMNNMLWLDNQRLIYNNEDGNRMVLWDAVEQHSQIISDEVFVGISNPMRLSPDGRQLAAFSIKAELIVWETSTFKKVMSVPIDTLDWAVLGVEWSPNGKYLLNPVFLVDVSEQEFVTKFQENAGIASWSPDGRYIALNYWDSTLRQTRFKIKETSALLDVMQFEGFWGRWIQDSFMTNTGVLVNMQAQTQTTLSDVPLRYLYPLCDESYAVGVEGNRILVWNIETAALATQVEIPIDTTKNYVDKLSFSSDCRQLASVDKFGNIIIWKVEF